MKPASFMKKSYAYYFKELENGAHIPVSRAECLHYDRDNPDKLQRWIWDYEEFTYCMRLPATEEGKRRGNKFLADLKKWQRSQAVAYGCIHADYCADKSAAACDGCPEYQSRTVSLDAVVENDDGDTLRGKLYEPQSDIGLPLHELIQSENVAALADFLETLCEADRQLYEYRKAGLTENEMADKLGKSRKTVSTRKKNQNELFRANASFDDFYGE